MIGLPKKKGKTVSTRPTAFILKSEWEKTRGKVLITSYFDHLFYVTLSLSLYIYIYTRSELASLALSLYVRGGV